MKKLFVASVVIFALFFTAIPFVLGGDSGIPKKVQVPTYQDIGVEKSPIESAPDITRVLVFATQGWYTAFFIFAVIFILIAAFHYLTAAGEPEKIQKAHKMLIWAAVAVAVALIAVGAAQIMKSFLGGDSAYVDTTPRVGVPSGGSPQGGATY